MTAGSHDDDHVVHHMCDISSLAAHILGSYLTMIQDDHFH